MSKVIRTGALYRMVGVLVAAVISLAVAAPIVAEMMLQQAEEHDAEVAARPVANPSPPPAAATIPNAPVQHTPVVFGEPTMPAAPVNHARLQEQSASQATETQSPNAVPSAAAKPLASNATTTQNQSPHVEPSLKAAPKPVEKPTVWQVGKIE